MKLQLTSEVLSRITSDQMRRIRRIEEEDYRFVQSKTGEDLATQGVQVSRDYLERGIVALGQYYAVAVLDPANAHAVGVPVDPFWHAHILFTEQYCRFCDDVVGEYMHHVPLDRTDDSKVRNVCELYDYTLQVLPRFFVEVDPTFWPVATSDSEVICMHKGNQTMYPALQGSRFFPPIQAGTAWAYA